MSISGAIELLSGKPLEALKSLDADKLAEIDEIRLRVSRPVSLSVGQRDIVLNNAIALSEDIEHTFKTAFSYSMHSYSKELSLGYITTSGGNRVGICGTAVTASDKYTVDTLKYISSVNIRIAREIKGCADGIVGSCFRSGLSGLLIVGPPSSGKTTVLRDLCRQLGNRYKISLIDELNEISATHRNFAHNDVGCLTDVFVGYPKHIGVSTAVRVMSPRAIVADEIGSEDDCKALEYALHSGVKLITAVHGESVSDARKKPAVERLIRDGAFDCAVELSPLREIRTVNID